MKKLINTTALVVIIFLLALQWPYSLIRKKFKLKPRIIWGFAPVINLKYWSMACRIRDYNSSTFVSGLYQINKEDDYDKIVILKNSRIFNYIFSIYNYISISFRSDIIIRYFNKGVISSKYFDVLQNKIWRIFGKKIVMVPYGSDIALKNYLGPFEDFITKTYPNILQNPEGKKEFIDSLSDESDFIIKYLQVGYIPRHDIMTRSCLGIDSSNWGINAQNKGAVSEPSVINIVHASNHFEIKGTHEIIAAVEKLKNEGFSVELEVLQNTPNDVVREKVMGSDIVVDQLIGGYGLFAIEAMSCGKPVISNMKWTKEYYGVEYDLKDCPIVSADKGTIYQALKELVTHPERIKTIGEKSREYVQRYHSIEAQAEFWDAIIRHVWWGEPLEGTAVDRWRLDL